MARKTGDIRSCAGADRKFHPERSRNLTLAPPLPPPLTSTLTLCAGNPTTDMSYDQGGALDFWHSHALISGETRRDILEYCDMVMEPMRHFCGPSGPSAPAGEPGFTNVQ